MLKFQEPFSLKNRKVLKCSFLQKCHVKQLSGKEKSFSIKRWQNNENPEAIQRQSIVFLSKYCRLLYYIVSQTCSPSPSLTLLSPAGALPQHVSQVLYFYTCIFLISQAGHVTSEVPFKSSLAVGSSKWCIIYCSARCCGNASSGGGQ